MTTDNDNEELESSEEFAPSKSELKRQMHDLQELGAAIVTLNKERIKALGLPEKLIEALKHWQDITAHGAKRRQLQYIGKLMRSVDPEPIRRSLEEQHKGSAEQTLQLHRLETLREQLLAEDENGKNALTQWLDEHPQADAQKLRSFIRAARKDASATPEQRNGRTFRELFKYLKEYES